MRLVSTPPPANAPARAVLCNGHGRHPVTGLLLIGRPEHGCPKCCLVCSIDAHRCPGCGASLNHGVGVCLRCRNAKEAP